MVESFHPLAHAAVATTCGSTLFIMTRLTRDNLVDLIVMHRLLTQ